ncbi:MULTISPECIES: YdeI/OmpD-associated family protein [unclassified Clostridium]|uniref:YdeI/OmpD-associated family protein n=1 Tax=unclassified Clostridium TaxID=2614128 RepID=UPI0005502E11|nr:MULTISPECIES: YdeI/OmpD-associated family protein [unclassified Clostridium]
MLFETRNDFRNWLNDNCTTSGGIWLEFSKSSSIKTLKASEALEEALCFGWIDGQMQSIDETKYLKYFSSRRKGSKWSEKNKNLVKELEAKGLMTDFGRAKVEEAKKNGMWNALKPEAITDKQVQMLVELIKDIEPACTNFNAMSPSARRNYTGLYFDAKSDEAKKRRLEKIIYRLNLNLKPM